MPQKNVRSFSKQFVIVSWLLVIVWACVIFFMSSRTDSGLKDEMNILSAVYQWLMYQQASIFGEGVDVLSPLAHFLEYVLLGVLLFNALRLHISLKQAFIATLVLAAAYAASDEIHQYFVPGRTCDPLDWLVDVVGTLVGSTLARIKLRNTKSNPVIHH